MSLNPPLSPKAASFTNGSLNSTHTSPDKGKAGRNADMAASTPEVHVNGAPVKPALRRPKSSTGTVGSTKDEAQWGSNFWVTLVDPQSGASFFACPATGQVSWDPPVGNFVLPPNDNGEWWEISDESRGGIPYYYHTKTGETVWEKPEGFVIPLTVLQNTALGRRLSKTFTTAEAVSASEAIAAASSSPARRPSNGRSRSYAAEQRTSPPPAQGRSSQSSSRSGGRIPASASSPANSSAHRKGSQAPAIRRSFSSDQHHTLGHGPAPHAPSSGSARSWSHGAGSLTAGHLPPIPGSPYLSEASEPSSPAQSRKSLSAVSLNRSGSTRSQRPPTPKTSAPSTPIDERPRGKNASYLPQRSPPQSLHAAVELLAQTPPSPRSIGKVSVESGYASAMEKDGEKEKLTGPKIAGREISGPVFNTEATMKLSPVKTRAEGKPILVEAPQRHIISHGSTTATLSTGLYPILPSDLAGDIQQFVESEFARQYFSTHRTGFIFKRKIPMEQMMTWQKAPLASPLLNLPRPLHKDAVKIFKVMQRLMGDREREARGGPRHNDGTSTVPSFSASTTSLPSGMFGLLEEERWLLGEGLTHGELRDEIYCQLTKQLTGNANTESVFKGWQLLCVLLVTFPPSKNFEPYLQSFLHQRTGQTEGRVDIMAKYCLKRLTIIAKKGPRGKPPTVSEIETASDAAFNPSTFGESLDAIYRLQERNYPHQKIPIILPFLSDGILALGGTKSEGIFRVPGDGDSVSELKLRIDKGYYNLEGVDDPHVLASLLKLWLRELCDPLVPEEMYNDCITYGGDPDACVGIVERLPTINRRVVLFVVSFLQLFLDEKVLVATKMTSANLALVMAPNLLRCSSDSMAVVFTNAQYEQTFVHNLLLHLKCDEIDPDYMPKHGLGAVSTAPAPRTSKLRRRPHA
ncbi:hypothetical protein EVG20_g9052 [Dentipellis fragilis]|uniref:Rho-GAP domain-containing protein n=1 Tax=Dentipellis fragilis TaxID=205917 RepID=A0A4Y9Y5M7_9AGAM|nr:hypothetical protein EVG20_g9052 [Dentipellis fragilis]